MRTNGKILIISAVFPPEPVVSSKLSADLAEKLALKHEITVITPRPSRPYGFNFLSTKRQFFYDHIILNSLVYPKSNLFGRFIESYSFGHEINKYIKAHYNEIEIIYANVWPLFAQFFTVKASKKFNIPVIIHVQDIYPEVICNRLPFIKKIIKTILLPVDRYILQNATRVIVITEKMKEYLAKTRSTYLNKFLVVNNWQDESEFVSYSKKLKGDNFNSNNNDVFTFMYLGNIGPLAGLDTVIDAFSIISDNHIRLVISGSGSMKDELERKIQSLNLKNIEFWSVPDGKVPEIQARADVMLLPIKKDAAAYSIPSKLPAYMFSAKPILACVDDNSDTANAILESGCGWVIESESVEKLIISIRKITKIDENHLNIMGQKGYEYAIQNYSKDSNLMKLINVINEHTK